MGRAKAERSALVNGSCILGLHVRILWTGARSEGWFSRRIAPWCEANGSKNLYYSDSRRNTTRLLRRFCFGGVCKRYNLLFFFCYNQEKKENILCRPIDLTKIDARDLCLSQSRSRTRESRKIHASTISNCHLKICKGWRLGITLHAHGIRRRVTSKERRVPSEKVRSIKD